MDVAARDRARAGGRARPPGAAGAGRRRAAPTPASATASPARCARRSSGASVPRCVVTYDDLLTRLHATLTGARRRRPPPPGCGSATRWCSSTSSRTPTRCSGTSCASPFHGHAHARAHRRPEAGDLRLPRRRRPRLPRRRGARRPPPHPRPPTGAATPACWRARRAVPRRRAGRRADRRAAGRRREPRAVARPAPAPRSRSAPVRGDPARVDTHPRRRGRRRRPPGRRPARRRRPAHAPRRGHPARRSAPATSRSSSTPTPSSTASTTPCSTPGVPSVRRTDLQRLRAPPPATTGSSCSTRSNSRSRAALLRRLALTAVRGLDRRRPRDRRPRRARPPAAPLAAGLPRSAASRRCSRRSAATSSCRRGCSPSATASAASPTSATSARRCTSAATAEQLGLAALIDWLRRRVRRVPPRHRHRTQPPPRLRRRGRPAGHGVGQQGPGVPDRARAVRVEPLRAHRRRSRCSTTSDGRRVRDVGGAGPPRLRPQPPSWHRAEDARRGPAAALRRA